MFKTCVQRRLWAVAIAFLSFAVTPAALAQKITLGVIAGASLTDDYRNTSLTSPSQTTRITNASQWFMFGPTVDVAFSKRVSVEVDAIRRRIRSTGVTIPSTPVEYPGGLIIGQFPFPGELHLAGFGAGKTQTLRKTPATIP